MKIEILNILKDESIDCFSILSLINTMDYLKFIDGVYKAGGGIPYQREPLKTNTAIRIRSRMISDIKANAVLPPVVIGIVLPQSYFDTIDNIKDNAFELLLSNLGNESISLIDGMQRTTALFEVPEINLREKSLRVEFWVSKNTNSLIYRMLVLNTGQVPWNIRRQIEVVFRSMIDEIRNTVKEIELISIEEAGRRRKPGQFQADRIIELFLVFGARKEKVNTKEQLADEFIRLDIVEATNKPLFIQMFYQVLEYLVFFDIHISKFQPNETENSDQYLTGKDLFSSQPVTVGFVASIAKEILGRPGIDNKPEIIETKWSNFKQSIEVFLSRLKNMESMQLEEFLDYPTLNEKLQRKTTKVGDFEREFFFKAFETLIEEKFELPTMTACWRAY